jgi:cytochrome c-type biogenesis protein CcmE
MAFKFGKMLVHAVIVGLLLAILIILVQGRSNFKSYYEPADIVTVAGPNAKSDPKSIFDLKVGLDCVAGPSEKAAYYSQGLTPGGLCDSGEYVRDQQRDYAIADGVGGSLLEK